MYIFEYNLTVLYSRCIGMLICSYKDFKNFCDILLDYNHKISTVKAEKTIHLFYTNKLILIFINRC